MYVKDRHFLANSAPEDGNVSNREKSGKSRNFPPGAYLMASSASRPVTLLPVGAGFCPARLVLVPPAAPFLSAAVRDVSLSGATHFCQQRQKWAKTPFKPAV